jgi:hypothetical protein
MRVLWSDDGIDEIDGVVAATEECGAPAATSVMTAGVCR